MSRFLPLENQLGERLDVVIAARLQVSRAQVQKLIGEGRVTVGGQWIRRPAFRLQRIAEIAVTLSEVSDARGTSGVPQAAPVLAPEPMPLDILHEDTAILVVNKPAGIVVHPGAGHLQGTLVNALLHHSPGLPVGPAAIAAYKPGIVHRLDRGTSGVMVVAKTEEAMVHLMRQFKQRTVEKKYLALVFGRPAAIGFVERAIGRHVRNRQRFSSHTRKGRPAVTSWRVLETIGPLSWLEVTLHTGRTHQIRVHLSEQGYPLVGDSQYGKISRRLRELEKQKGAAWVERLQCLKRPALHAAVLGFAHPLTEEKNIFTAPLAADIRELLEWCRTHR